jgi:hypothetical protein
MDAVTSSRTEELVTAMPLAESTLWLLRLIGDEKRLQELFNKHRGRGYEKVLTFPLLVQLVGDSLLQQGGRGYRVFSRAREDGTLDATIEAVYGKLGRLNIDLSIAFLGELTDPLRELFPKAARRKPPQSLRKFETVILDGKAIKRVAKRLKPLRGVAGGMLGGRTLVALQYATGLALALHAEPDGHANDSRFVPFLLPAVRERLPGTRLWVADRGFCDLQRLTEFTEDGDHFLVRFHPKNGFHRDPKRGLCKGRDAQGRHFYQEWGWIGAETHKHRHYVRRITLCRAGEEDVILVTDLLSSEDYPATELLEHYSERWGIERVFQQITETFGLQGLIGCTPEATIFQFSFCLLLYNVLQTVRGYVSMHQRRECETISLENIFVDTREELTAWTVLLRRGVVTAEYFRPKTVEETRQHVHGLLRDEWSDRWIKATNKKPRPPVKHSSKPTHGSVYRLLQAARQRS